MITERTADGKQLIFTALDPERGRGPELARFQADPNTPYFAEISPDGTRIALVSWPKGQFHILSSKGELLQQFTVEKWRTFLNWTADGRGLFVSISGPQGEVLAHV